MSENKEMKLTVASSPHVNSPVSTRSLMLDVLIALIPALCVGTYFFGPRALLLTAGSLATSSPCSWSSSSSAAWARTS